MPRKCVSLGGVGLLTPPAGGDSIADLDGGPTKDGKTNQSYFNETGTGYVRVFVRWDFFWNCVPTQQTGPGQPYAAPAPILAQLVELNNNIRQAKANTVNGQPRPLKVILTTRAFPPWANDGKTSPFQFVFPPNNVLMLPSATPPNGTAFQPQDFQYAQWVFFLMYTYHPSNQYLTDPSDPRYAYKDIWVDQFELVNEPDYECAPYSGNPGPVVPNYKSTALMMSTSWTVKNFLNAALNVDPKTRKQLPRTAYIGLLAPASAGSIRQDATHPRYDTFNKQLIEELVANYPAGLRHDSRFGWSLHNYADVEQIGLLVGAIDPATVRELLKRYPGLTSLVYGHHTQTVRDIIRGSWFGAGNQAHPRIWLTEGGARLSHLAGYKPPTKNKKVDTSPNTDQRAAKRAQQIAVGVAAQALKQTGAQGAGRGVEMFTQFLFYDQPPPPLVNFPCGLLNTYAPGETSTQEKRPAYSSWKYWRL